jgi:hypothetical protein
MELKNEHGKLCIDPSGFRENRKDISKRLIWACRANFALSKVNILWSNLIFLRMPLSEVRTTLVSKFFIFSECGSKF